MIQQKTKNEIEIVLLTDKIFQADRLNVSTNHLIIIPHSSGEPLCFDHTLP